jgi:phage I-like protein
VVAAFVAHGMPFPVDYEHQSIEAETKTGPTPAAGWIVALESRQDGLWGQVEWTAAAAAMIAAREYRYLSPVFFFAPKTGAISALAGAGLTNAPNLHLRALSRAQHQESRMDELLERLRYMLNLPTLATPEEVVAELQKLVDKLGATDTAAATAAQRLGLDPAASPAPAVLESALAHLEVQRTALGVLREHVTLAEGQSGTPAELVQAAIARVSALERQAAERDAADRVTAAMRERLIEPAKRDWAMGYARRDPAGFGAYLASCTPIALDAAHRQGPPADGDSDFDALVSAAEAADTKLSRGAAMMRVARTHPEIHRAWVESHQQAGR